MNVIASGQHLRAARVKRHREIIGDVIADDIRDDGLQDVMNALMKESGIPRKYRNLFHRLVFSMMFNPEGKA
jgi:hypothetical protein